jgi:hypothetical protein
MLSRAMTSRRGRRLLPTDASLINRHCHSQSNQPSRNSHQHLDANRLLICKEKIRMQYPYTLTPVTRTESFDLPLDMVGS